MVSSNHGFPGASVTFPGSDGEAALRRLITLRVD